MQTVLTEFEWFQNLTPSEQKTYMETFADVDAFFVWYNAAKEENDRLNPPIDVGNGIIDISKIIEEKD